VSTLLEDAVVDLNSEVEELGDEFYYREKMRDQKWVVKFIRQLVTEHEKLVQRGRIPSFKDEWEKAIVEA
jgi:hypothetical protein